MANYTYIISWPPDPNHIDPSKRESWSTQIVSSLSAAQLEQIKTAGAHVVTVPTEMGDETFVQINGQQITKDTEDNLYYGPSPDGSSQNVKVQMHYTDTSQFITVEYQFTPAFLADLSWKLNGIATLTNYGGGTNEARSYDSDGLFLDTETVHVSRQKLAWERYGNLSISEYERRYSTINGLWEISPGNGIFIDGILKPHSTSSHSKLRPDYSSLGGMYLASQADITKFNYQGDILWEYTPAGGSSVRVRDFDVDRDGNVYYILACINELWLKVGKVSSAGILLWEELYEGPGSNNSRARIAVDKYTSEAYVLREVYETEFVLADKPHLFKIDSSGNKLWEKAPLYISPTTITIEMATDYYGYLFLTAKIQGQTPLLTKFDHNGVIVWSQAISSATTYAEILDTETNIISYNLKAPRPPAIPFDSAKSNFNGLIASTTGGALTESILVPLGTASFKGNEGYPPEIPQAPSDWGAEPVLDPVDPLAFCQITGGTSSLGSSYISQIVITNADTNEVLYDSEVMAHTNWYYDLTANVIECTPGDVLSIAVTIHARAYLYWAHSIDSVDLEYVDYISNIFSGSATRTYTWQVPNVPGVHLISWLTSYDSAYGNESTWFCTDPTGTNKKHRIDLTLGIKNPPQLLENQAPYYDVCTGYYRTDNADSYYYIDRIEIRNASDEVIFDSGVLEQDNWWKRLTDQVIIVNQNEELTIKVTTWQNSYNHYIAWAHTIGYDELTFIETLGYSEAQSGINYVYELEYTWTVPRIAGVHVVSWLAARYESDIGDPCSSYEKHRVDFSIAIYTIPPSMIIPSITSEVAKSAFTGLMLAGVALPIVPEAADPFSYNCAPPTGAFTSFDQKVGRVQVYHRVIGGSWVRVADTGTLSNPATRHHDLTASLIAEVSPGNQLFISLGNITGPAHVYWATSLLTGALEIVEYITYIWSLNSVNIYLPSPNIIPDSPGNHIVSIILSPTQAYAADPCGDAPDGTTYKYRLDFTLHVSGDGELGPPIGGEYVLLEASPANSNFEGLEISTFSGNIVEAIAAPANFTGPIPAILPSSSVEADISHAGFTGVSTMSIDAYQTEIIAPKAVTAFTGKSVYLLQAGVLTFSAGALALGDITLPRLHVLGGELCYANIVLPNLEVKGHLRGNLFGNIILPKLTVFGGDIDPNVLTSLEVYGTFGGNFDESLTPLIVDGSIFTHYKISTDIILPKINIDGSFSGSGTITLEPLEVDGKVYTQEYLSGKIVLKNVEIFGNIITDANTEIVLPKLSVFGELMAESEFYLIKYKNPRSIDEQENFLDNPDYIIGHN